ncbi:MAG TPA: hypothetical protein VGB99_05130 [Acidobacteriota bacterium]
MPKHPPPVKRGIAGAALQNACPIRRKLSLLAGFFVFPCAFYLACFFILTFPLVTTFSTHYFFNLYDDGPQNAWNIWWLNKAITELHQLPFYTTYLNYPGGVSLLGHTLTPLNGLFGIVLLRFFELQQTFNLLFIFTFVASGLSAFALAFYVTRAYWPSIVGGYLFAFCSYRFSHAVNGHLNLLSTEWIPLFALFWMMLLERPRIPAAVAAALMLFLSLLSDYYCFINCLLFGALSGLWWTAREKKPLGLLRPPLRTPLLAFLATALVSSGPILFALLKEDMADPFRRARLAGQQLDLMDLFVYGETFRFGEWAQALRRQIHPAAYNIGLSVYVGWSVVVLVALLLLLRKQARPQERQPWLLGLVAFALISLGRSLWVWGKEFPELLMPYRLLEVVLPPLRISGRANRQMILVFLMAAVLCAASLSMLWRRGVAGRLAGGFLIALLVVEYLPAPLAASRIEVPAYVIALKDAPRGGVLDMAASSSMAFVYQTIHQQPMAFGFVARFSRSATRERVRMKARIRARKFGVLSNQYRIRYLVTPKQRFVTPYPRGGIPHLLYGQVEESDQLKLILADQTAYLYQLGNPTL